MSQVVRSIPTRGRSGALAWSFVANEPRSASLRQTIGAALGWTHAQVPTMDGDGDVDLYAVLFDSELGFGL